MATLAEIKTAEESIAAQITAVAANVAALKAGQADQSTIDAIAAQQAANAAALDALKS